MKKKGIVVRVAVLAVVLCLVTMCLTAGTLAKYASEAAGNATATVAKWDIALKEGTNDVTESGTIDLKLADTAKVTDNLVAADRIAPGTSGTLELTVDGGATEVAYTYTIELDMSGTDLATAPIKFYADDQKTPLTLTNNKLVVTGEVLTNASSKTSTQTVYWEWDSSDYTTDAAYDTVDKKDTKAGTDSATMTLTYTIPVTIRAEQKVS